MSGSLPGLIDFYEQHRGDQRFEILAFHEDSIATLAELDEKLETVKAKYWNGRDLPFPVLVDGTATTERQYEIHFYPTMLLVDPEGRFVKLTHGVDDLKEKLGIVDGEAEGQPAESSD